MNQKCGNTQDGTEPIKVSSTEEARERADRQGGDNLTDVQKRGDQLLELSVDAIPRCQRGVLIPEHLEKSRHSLIAVHQDSIKV